MAADFQNVYRYNVSLCSSVVLADVSEHKSNPAGENELRFVVGTCVFLLLAWFGIAACFPLSYIVGKNVDADCWFLGWNVDAVAAKRNFIFIIISICTYTTYKNIQYTTRTTYNTELYYVFFPFYAHRTREKKNEKEGKDTTYYICTLGSSRYYI